ncbi:hypothetical protein DVR12_16265 [Chitinophaga silvatica]|uniref:Uncharacterized protein n=1 Tax=Chitinophaga silvatica TaxID=2282649 RepID=A0A3E1Y7R2_9BACT|nr:hypothetical protein [Chitinophaga silvatica]RFS20908.1 hypothetical protein DVR12_16265 [Chitinophaga silvatica]
MKANILLMLFCLLACAAYAQTVPEGTSIRQTKSFVNRFKEIQVLEQKSNASGNNRKIPPKKPSREIIFENYQPGKPGTPIRPVSKTNTIPSDKPTEKRKDSVTTKIFIPDQGTSTKN